MPIRCESMDLLEDLPNVIMSAVSSEIQKLKAAEVRFFSSTCHNEMPLKYMYVEKGKNMSHTKNTILATVQVEMST